MEIGAMSTKTHHSTFLTTRFVQFVFERVKKQYPEGPAWGSIPTSTVRKEILSLAQDDGTIRQSDLAHKLLCLHRGKVPADANKALQAIIMEIRHIKEDAEDDVCDDYDDTCAA